MSQGAAPVLRRITLAELPEGVRSPVDSGTLNAASEIVNRVRAEGAAAARDFAERFGERAPGEPLVVQRDDMDGALDTLEPEARGVLRRTAERIRTFARAQREAIRPLDVPIDGGQAGHTIEPVCSAGCYAPAGRYPLPSSVLMTAITARVAGCERVVVASPGAHPVALAAASIAGADEFLAVGGAHAIASMAYGVDGLKPCDVIVGPGNRWVTAAKQLVSGVVGIDMLAGPSELLIVVDASANADLVAVDLLAQAEHDSDAVPMLVCTDSTLPDRVDAALARRLAELPTREVAASALGNGFVCVVGSIEEACLAADTIAAEHVEVMTEAPGVVADTIRNAGGVFIGPTSAEVLGDYGAGPNHTLPTGGTARFQAGLSVLHFLRLRTWMRIDDADAGAGLVRDAAALAALEGLAGHRLAALERNT